HRRHRLAKAEDPFGAGSLGCRELDGAPLTHVEGVDSPGFEQHLFVAFEQRQGGVGRVLVRHFDLVARPLEQPLADGNLPGQGEDSVLVHEAEGRWFGHTGGAYCVAAAGRYGASLRLIRRGSTGSWRARTI